MMQVKVCDYLSDDSKMIREKVFMEEQGFENEFDDTDEIATQIVMYDEDKPVATCRIFNGASKEEFIFGRLAVLKEYRGRNIGTKVIQEAEKLVLEKGGKSMALHAQCRVKGFYEAMGYRAFGEVEDDEGCPHIWMKKALQE